MSTQTQILESIYNIYNNHGRLNKNLITHFVSYLEKEIRCDIETLSTDRLLSKKHSHGKLCRKYAPKASPRPHFKFC